MYRSVIKPSLSHGLFWFHPEQSARSLCMWPDVPYRSYISWRNHFAKFVNLKTSWNLVPMKFCLKWACPCCMINTCVWNVRRWSCHVYIYKQETYTQGLFKYLKKIDSDPVQVNWTEIRRIKKNQCYLYAWFDDWQWHRAALRMCKCSRSAISTPRSCKNNTGQPLSNIFAKIFLHECES